MGFNAVLASATAARNFIARRQIDKRVKLLCHFDGNLKNEITGQFGTSTRSLVYESGVIGSNCIKAEGGTITFSGIDLSGDFCIEWFYKRQQSYQASLQIGNSTNRIAWYNAWHQGAQDQITNSLILLNGDTPLVNKVCVNIIDDTWEHLCVSRRSGTIYMFKDGLLMGTGTSTLDLTSPSLMVTWWTREHFSYIDELRIVSGAAVHTSNFTPPTTPYTGFEPLG